MRVVHSTGDYEMSEATGVGRGSKIILHLKPSHKEFAVRHNIERIVKKYSNFGMFVCRCVIFVCMSRIDAFHFAHYVILTRILTMLQCFAQLDFLFC
jgi:hypothetical protein